MNIGIIGSGGREHSLCYKIKQSKKIKKIYCFPGNVGTSEIATNIKVNLKNFGEVYRIFKEKEINLVIVGPEEPLVDGIVDYFENKKIRVFGPSKTASQLEGSKIFMKKICDEFKIPTAKYSEIFNLSEAENFIDKFKLPIVVKSDGLAAGKGVTICKNKDEALRDIKDIFDGKFKSSNKVILEEFIEGEEISFFIITDGDKFKVIGTAQDHKRIGEGDTGLNTGGMGAYSPSLLINKILEKKIIDKIIKPTLLGMKKKGYPYKGVLFAGLMIKDNEPKLIEYNIRFGDPECQVLMMRLKNDLLDLILSVFENNLDKQKIIWSKKPCITVVAANKGYPTKFKKNTEIKNIHKIKQNENFQLFHAGTNKDEKGKIRATGGRVLNATVIANSLRDARHQANNILDNIDWDNKYYRKDIGFKAID